MDNYLATGGVSGGIMAGLYIAYKCCYRRKFRSKCCGSEVDVSAGEPSPVEAPKETFPTPKPSPALKAADVPIDIPTLKI